VIHTELLVFRPRSLVLLTKVDDSSYLNIRVARVERKFTGHTNNSHNSINLHSLSLRYAVLAAYPIFAIEFLWDF
jgi:hypothetical protein